MEPEGWDRIEEQMTTEQAWAIRGLRIEGGFLSVAQRFYDQFGDALYDQGLSANPATGVYLCKAAADVLGEDFAGAPWQSLQPPI
jgi:hypothetical protein